MATSERKGHGQLVREYVQGAMVEVLSGSLAGQVAHPEAEAHKIVTKPGGMGLWFEEIARMASANDEPVLERASRIVEALRLKLLEQQLSLPGPIADKLAIAMVGVFGTPNADPIFEALAEAVNRRLVKFIEQVATHELPANHAELRTAFEKDVRRILGRLRYRKATADATDDALVCRAGFLLCQLDATWGQTVLDELNALGSDLWDLLATYREDETP